MNSQPNQSKRRGSPYLTVIGALALSFGQAAPALAHFVIDAVLKFVDELERARGVKRLADLSVGRVGLYEPQVVCDAARQQRVALRDIGDELARVDVGDEL